VLRKIACRCLQRLGVKACPARNGWRLGRYKPGVHGERMQDLGINGFPYGTELIRSSQARPAWRHATEARELSHRGADGGGEKRPHHTATEKQELWLKTDRSSVRVHYWESLSPHSHGNDINGERHSLQMPSAHAAGPKVRPNQSLASSFHLASKRRVARKGKCCGTREGNMKTALGERPLKELSYRSQLAILL